MFPPRTLSLMPSWTVVLIAIIFACVPLSSAGESQVHYFGRNILVEGDSMEILCEATLFEPIVWLKDGKGLISGSNGYSWKTWNENNVIKSVLKVSHVNVRHSGSYQCTPVHQESHHVYVVSAKITIENVENSTEAGDFKIIVKKEPLELKCTIDEEGFNLVWRKELSVGVYNEIKDGISKSKDGKEAILKIMRPLDENAGNYSCVAANKTDIAPGNIQVLSYPTGTLSNDVIVVEGEKLTLDCQPTGVPTPKVTWVIGDNNTLNASTDRVKLLPNKNNITNALLEIKDVQMTDRAEYKCVLTNTATVFKNDPVEVVSKVRVKDKLAALWPFLGICAEVFVLCAIIFIYEKKRNKAELDESDTDNSPEQKNTPDHGKDSVRQRK